MTSSLWESSYGWTFPVSGNAILSLKRCFSWTQGVVGWGFRKKEKGTKNLKAPFIAS